MSLEIPPFLCLLAGALLLPLLPRRWRGWAFLIAPAAALLLIWKAPDGLAVTVRFLPYELVLCKVDALSRVFGMVFAFVTLAAGIYGLHVRDTTQQLAALCYGAGALGVTFAGDFLTLLVFWEVMAVASTLLIWARRTPAAAGAGLRYLLFHLFGGSCLFAGIAWHLAAGPGALQLEAFTRPDSPAAWLVLLGVAVNAAVVPLHAWLTDSYPKATITGAVFLSALTTKSAVYVLARLFPGWGVLLAAGVLMVLWGSLFGLLSNDIREILAYSTISQVGYMVTGVGIGTQLALDGVAAHAFSHILYKALLFMAAGAVIETTGHSKLTELGGLGRIMPVTFALYMVGALAISGLPLLNGFISKSMIISAAGHEHHYPVLFLLVLGSIGTFLHTGLRLPYFTFLGSPRNYAQLRLAPWNMTTGMLILALACIGFGVAPGLLYQWLPHQAGFHPYTIPHLIEAVQTMLLAWAGFLLLKTHLAPRAVILLDADWCYRRLAPAARLLFVDGVAGVFDRCQAGVDRLTMLAARIAINPRELWRERRLPETRFEPDRARLGIGLSVALTILMVVLVTLWGLWR